MTTYTKEQIARLTAVDTDYDHEGTNNYYVAPTHDEADLADVEYGTRTYVNASKRSVKFGDKLAQLAREAAEDCSDEIKAILNEKLDNESPAYSAVRFEDDNGQMIDVVAEAMGHQTQRKNADDFEGIVGDSSVSNLMVVLENLKLFVGREASWTGGFNPEAYANKARKLAIAGIEDIVLDSNGKARKPTKTGKVRRTPVARRKARK